MGVPNTGGLLILEAFRPVLYGVGGKDCYLCVIKETFTDAEDLAWGDLVEADYKGYARKKILIGDVGNAVELDGDPVIPMSLTLWQFDPAALTGAAENSLYGWAIIQEQPNDSAGHAVPPKLVAVRRWPDGEHGEAPFVLNATEPAMQFAPRIAYRWIAP